MRAWIAKYTTVLILALLVLAAAGLLTMNRLRGEEVNVQTARQRPIMQTIVATGRVMSPARVEVGSVIAGRVLEVTVREGDKVEAGKVLLELDSSELKATLKQAEAAVQSARARLANVSELGLATAAESLAQANTNLAWNEAELKRNRELRASGFIGEAKLQEVVRAHSVAKSQYDAARTQVQAQSQRGVQSREAVARLDEAIAARELAAAKLAQTTVRASAAGTILTRSVEPGDVVQPGRTVLTLASAGETRISAQIDEKNLPFVKMGDLAVASADAFPERKFKAEVVYIAPSVDVQRGAVEARLRVASPPEHLRADMTLSVEIVGAQKDSALVIPLDAVRAVSHGEATVLTIADGKALARKVKLGLRGGDLVEIREGLQQGEEVIVGGATQPGARVRSKPAASAR